MSMMKFVVERVGRIVAEVRRLADAAYSEGRTRRDWRHGNVFEYRRESEKGFNLLIGANFVEWRSHFERYQSISTGIDAHTLVVMEDHF